MDIKPLNPLLHALLERRFGRVKVSSPGVPYRARRRTDAQTGRVREEVIERGEMYVVCCPRCKDTRYRLYVHHRFGVRDEAGGLNLRHIYCWNEDCYKEYVRRRDFYEDLQGVGYDIAAADIRRVEAEESRRVAALPGDCVPLDSLPDSHPAIAYLRERRFDPAALSRRYGIVWCRDSVMEHARERIIIPVREGGVLRGWQARLPFDSPRKVRGIPKYWTMPGTPLGHLVYNADLARRYRTTIVCEGVTDAWRVGPMGVALFGCKLPEAKRRALHSVARDGMLALVLDADRAGIQDLADVARRLRENLPGAVAVIRLDAGRDPADYARPDLRAIIQAQAAEQGVVVSFERRPSRRTDVDQ